MTTCSQVDRIVRLWTAILKVGPFTPLQTGSFCSILRSASQSVFHSTSLLKAFPRHRGGIRIIMNNAGFLTQLCRVGSAPFIDDDRSK